MLKKIIVHPFLFALYPVLFLYDHNKDLVSVSYVLRSMILSLVLAIFTFMIVKVIVRENQKSSLITSLFLFLFFSFGHFVYSYKYVHVFLWFVIFVSISVSIVAARKSIGIFCQFLNVFAISLVAIPLINLGVFYKKPKMIEQVTSSIEGPVTKADNKIRSYPDIYYIIFDGYARADVLNELYNYNNDDFINWLKSKGFYVADQSVSNYPQTYLSVASSLNIEYLDGISKVVGNDSSDRSALAEMIKNNKIRDILKAKGYKFVALPHGWGGAYNFAADINIVYENIIKDVSDFEDLFANTTLLSIFWDREIRIKNHRNRILFPFNHLSEVAKIDGNKFIYVHFLCPHPPFVFNDKGEWVEPGGRATGLDGDHYFNNNPGREEYRTKYVNQVKFLNEGIKTMVEAILKESENQPIIILQSDHGPGADVYWEQPYLTNMRERLSILNAYYVPEKVRRNLYNSITPVNTFRVVFNSVFELHYDLLPDRSYFSTWSHPFAFIDVSEIVKKPIHSAFPDQIVQKNPSPSHPKKM